MGKSRSPVFLGVVHHRQKPSDSKTLFSFEKLFEFDLHIIMPVLFETDRLCGLVVGVLSYRSGGYGSIPGTTRKKAVGPV
jgi:hypothetical protein